MNDLRLPDLFGADPIDDAFRALMRPWRLGQGDGAPRIKLDVSEQDEAYLVTAEIPGVRKEDIDVRIDGSLVTIGVQTTSEQQETQAGRVLCRERQQGFASRSFTLDSAVDEARATARYDNGVLSLTLPKQPAAARRKLAIA